VAPNSNSSFEPRKFSAKHSEFMKLKAHGLHKQGTQEQYKVIVEYPDGSSSVINLQHGGASNSPIEQVIEVR